MSALLLLVHSKLDSTVRYVGLEKDIQRDKTLEAGLVNYYSPNQLREKCKASELALAKRTQYQDEEEFRVIRQSFSATNQHQYFSFKFSPESIARIYLNNWHDETLLSHKKDEIKKWTEVKYKDLQILGNRTLEFTKWIREVERVTAGASSDRA